MFRNYGENDFHWLESRMDNTSAIQNISRWDENQKNRNIRF